MVKSNSRLRYLFEVYYCKTATRQEIDELFELVKSELYSDEIIELIQEFGLQNADNQSVFSTVETSMIYQKINLALRKPKLISFPSRKNLFRISAVAASVLFVIAGYFILKQRKIKNESDLVAKAQKFDYSPGKQGAILTLANGTQINLDTVTDGQLKLKGGVIVTKKGGRLIYHSSSSVKEEILNTVNTPRGRQYELVLSDGTKVWLNTESSITYLNTFKVNERVVSITGEVYFEVAHNPKAPFRVNFKSPDGRDGMIEVLGTHFNVNSYADEKNVKATLVEGKVRVFSHPNNLYLEPGQQAEIEKAGRLVKNNNVDVMEVIAWKNGYFEFNNEDITSVMRQVSRWYDIKVVYSGKIQPREFAGKIGRDLSLTQVLKILDNYGIHSKIENDKLILYN